MPPAAGGKGKETFKESPLDLSGAKASCYKEGSPFPRTPLSPSFKPFYYGVMGRCGGMKVLPRTGLSQWGLFLPLSLKPFHFELPIPTRALRKGKLPHIRNSLTP